MGRIIKTIEIEGRPVALFDTGATYTCVCSPLLRGAPRMKIKRPVRVTLGGQNIEIKALCFFEGKIEGLDFFADAVPVRKLGHADGHKLEVIIGARTMEQWELRLDPKSGTVNLEGLKRREFTEY